MKMKYRMIVTGILCFCLVFVAANTAVMAQDDDYWGDLVVGDKMIWDVSGILDGTQVDAEFEIRVLEIEGKTLTVNMTASGTAGGFYGFTVEENKLVYEDEIAPWISPASKLEGIGSKEYNWKGEEYDAVYYYNEQSDGSVEVWISKNTGIMFELDFVSETDNIDVTAKLDWTNASLETAGCFGTILIALFTIVSVVSYGAVKLKKKK